MSDIALVQSDNKRESEGKTRSEQRMTERLTLMRVRGGDSRWRDDKDRGRGAWRRERTR